MATANHQVKAIAFRDVGRIPQMPFAEKGGAVAGVLHGLAQRVVVLGKIIG